MRITARVCDLNEILSLRQEYREEMNCQIIHDSIHERPGWSVEYALEAEGETAGYGSVAVGGPWKQRHALYEFYVKPEQRGKVFALFAVLLAECGAATIETQTNEVMLPVMLHTFASNVRADAILFEDRLVTELKPEGAGFRAATAQDAEQLKLLELDDGAKFVATLDGEVAGAGGVLYHYNRPYGDIYMKIGEPFQRRGLGAYLVQELKAACRAGGSVPAARCNIRNVASRRTLQKAGFVPCGNIVEGDLIG